MDYKRDMYRVIHLLLLLLSQYTELIYSDSDPNQAENPVKRYNLQDLISQAGVQLTPGVNEQEEQAPKPQTIDVSELLSAAKTAASRQDASISSEDLISKFTKPKSVDIDVTADKNGNLNLADIPGLTRAPAASNPMNTIDLASLLGGQHQSSLESASHNNEQSHVVKEEFNLGKQKLEVEAAGKRTTRYTLAKGPDGGLNLIPILDPSDNADKKYELMQPKGYEEGAKSRQQMQLTTLSQALYSPFPSEANILHLHLKGKDGKDGKAGPKGPMGGLGPKGPEGPKGPKGDAGTCSAQINGLFECTPDELDSLSNRVDYLEKICKKKAPPPPFKRIGIAGTEGNPLPSCQAIYEKNPNSKSGAFWLMTNGVRYRTWCEFIREGSEPNGEDDERPPLAGGWTLVARVKGQATDWSPVSELWSNTELLNENTASDIKRTTSMKNVGWNLLKSDVLLLCYTGHNAGCAPFTHGKHTTLQDLFKNNYGIVPEEQYTMAPFMKAIGKSCDLSILRQSWCGLNLANVCNAKKSSPNDKPPTTTHIVRIGCIGDRTATCFPDDYAVGIGVTSCKDGFGCSNVGPSKNMHYRCDYVYGAFSQTAFLYVL